MPVSLVCGGDVRDLDRLADPHADHLPGLVEHLVDEARGAQAGMDLPQDMERFRIPAFEEDGNDRESGFLDQLDDVLRPGNVLHDLLLRNGGLVLPLLPGAHFTGREQA